MTDKIDGAVRGLRELKSAFNMRGANAITIERVVSTIYTLKADRDKWRNVWMTSAHEEAEAYRERDEAVERATQAENYITATKPKEPVGWVSHASAWRNALVIAKEHAEIASPDIDDKAYWQHEINALDTLVHQSVTATEPKQEGRIAELGLSGGDIVERVTEHDKWSVKDIGCTYKFVSHSMYCHSEHLIKLPIGSGWTSGGDKGIFRVVSRAGSSQ